MHIIYFESHLYLPRSSAEFGLPPRKRKISQEVDARYEPKKTNMNKQIHEDDYIGLKYRGCFDDCCFVGRLREQVRS